MDSCISSMFSLAPCNEYIYRDADNGSSAVSMHNLDDEYNQLWKDFPEVTDPSRSKVVNMTTPLHIVTKRPRIFTPVRKWHGSSRRVANGMVMRKLKSKNNCASWSWRVCGEFRRVNTVTHAARQISDANVVFIQ